METKLSRWARACLQGSRKKVGAVMAAAGLGVATVVFATSTALLNLNLFELDKNAQNGAAAGDDADQIYCDKTDPGRVGSDCTGVAASSSTKLVSNFVRDPVGDDDDNILNSPKDSLEILSSPTVPQDWTWKFGEPNDKNDIGSVFVTLHQYKDPAGIEDDYVLYFGLDKFAENGDAAIGFWFLQNDVAPIANGAKGTFAAGHKDGDVLVQADLVNGGTVGRFDVYTWGPNALLNQLVAPSQGDLRRAILSTDCVGGVDKFGDPLPPAHPSACAVVNGTGQTAPWPYITKNVEGESDIFPPSTYFEAGLKLNDLFPEGIPCVQTFLAETRQSQSETAALEDFVYGTFDLCSLTVQKTGPALAKVGDTVTYNVSITNSGALPLTKVSIVDSLAGIKTSECGAKLEAGESCNFSYTYVIGSGSDPVENTVTAIYNVANGSSPTTASSSHSVNLFSLGVTLDKKVNSGGGFNNGPVTIHQGESVDYSIYVKNTSSADAPPLNCGITDALVNIDPTDSDGDGNIHTLAVSLAPGASHTVTASSGPLTTVGNVVNTANVLCFADGFSNGVDATDTVTVKVDQRPVGITVDKSGDGFSKVGDVVNYTIVISNPTGAKKLPVDITSISDTLVGSLTDGTNAAITSFDCPTGTDKLAVGASCTITLTRTTLSTDPDPLVNKVTVNAQDEFANTTSANDDHTVDLVSPAIEVTKSCLQEPVTPGQSANFRIRVQNTGDVPLLVDITDTAVDPDIALTDVLLGKSASCVFGEASNDASDGCLEIEAGVIAGNSPVVNSVDVHWSLQSALGLANEDTVTKGDTCDVTSGDATRTLGFWKAHGSDGNRFDPPVEFGYTCHVAALHGGGLPINLGWKSLGTCGDVFGIFWANPAKQSNGTKRPALCQTKLHASWQLIAAILNTRLTNGEAIPTDSQTGLSLIEAMQNALQTTNRAEIIRLQGLLGAYNEGGDDVAIEDSDGAVVPPADPNGTRLAAKASPTIGDCSP